MRVGGEVEELRLATIECRRNVGCRSELEGEVVLEVRQKPETEAVDIIAAQGSHSYIENTRFYTILLLSNHSS